MATQIYLSLSVKDLNRSIEFFTKLGFTFNAQMTSADATCMIVGENIFVWLLAEKLFQAFAPNQEIADARKTTEVLISIDVESPAAVDEMVAKALNAGATNIGEAEDHDGAYSMPFADLDGHRWNVFYHDEPVVKEQNGAEAANQTQQV